ncbi:bifunctional tetrahydrofolate synthase/dihydrofolate synthase [Halopseudomonas nanhaiensis]|uniref:bifunctional tetrahydrofolate synthase/dihydrofolate synthase n=1 Tax=Halopseudomonas nanhaiensis TaxID=2830842 RepID=UPI001CBBA695|nr:bifunctional tetrahydrofolate synthase/dihydrofolate synthase [Halopseudomonas nanhaiensis]UAW99731.1 bifunctional tetrahydrofolate synthase/dihydrofolate synthase [Halopseudomonas nanhaiensis]
MLPSSLPEWLARLEGLHPTEIDMGLARVAEVARRLDVLKPAELVFTVTGTNGKGSTCAGLESLLRAAGLRTGLYTSPHLLRYNERVCIDGQPVPDADLCLAFETIEAARGVISLTYFEFATLAALWLFRRAGVAAVVLEVGLGGRLDAVNIVDADIAVVTSIGLDHAEYLGDTRDSVGYEKAGIGRAGRPLVCGEPDLPDGFVQEVVRRQARLIWRGRDFHLRADAEGTKLQGADAGGHVRTLSVPDTPLPIDNLVLALQAFWLAGLDMPDAVAAQALRDAFVAGRLERRTISWHGQPRRLLLDVGHNPHAAAFLARALRRDQVPRHAVFGLLADKDLSGVVAELHGIFDGWAVAPLASPRSRPARDLVTHLIATGERAEACESVAEALQTSLDETPAGTEIVVFGSFFCVADAILWLSTQTQELTNG